jgi:hypothetical protein
MALAVAILGGTGMPRSFSCRLWGASLINSTRCESGRLEESRRGPITYSEAGWDDRVPAKVSVGYKAQL